MSYKNIDKQREFQRDWQKKQRLLKRNKVLAILGNKCVDCGNKDTRVLQIDHIEPILRPYHVKTLLFHTGSTLIRDLITKKIDFKEVTIRCANCHMIKTAGEHQKYKYKYKGL